jgi:hypothetical protein
VTEPIPAERLAAAVPVALSLITSIDRAQASGTQALDAAVHTALDQQHDPEAVVLVLANMAHALVHTLARQTGASVDDLIASLAQVGNTMRGPSGGPGPS